MGYIPKPEDLLSDASRTAFSNLIEGIRGADTERELLIFMERYYQAASDMRALVTQVDGEILRKLRQLRDEGEEEGRGGQQLHEAGS